VSSLPPDEPGDDAGPHGLPADRGPGGRWLAARVLLGLLVASLLILIGLFAYHLVLEPSGSARVCLFAALGWLYVAGPHLLLVYALWRGGQDDQIITVAVACAPVFLILSLGLLLLAFFRQWESSLGPCCFCLAPGVWFAGWPLAIKAAVLAHGRARMFQAEGDE
jgi:hypothetical protein